MFTQSVLLTEKFIKYINRVKVEEGGYFVEKKDTMNYRFENEGVVVIQ